MKHSRLDELFVQANYNTADKKDILRNVILAQRRKLQPKELESASEMLCEMALLLAEVEAAQTIALYASRTTEPSTNLLLNVLSRRNKNVLLPVLADTLARNWAKFISVEDLHERIKGRPPEPSSPHLGEEVIRDADVILAPGLAVDMQGNRLGHGGGWYDRVLAIKKPETKVFTLLYDSEIYTDEILPTEKHDQKVDGIITEKQIIRLT
jgi:5-formyltetrahydrofolate cyclo-ligase